MPYEEVGGVRAPIFYHRRCSGSDLTHLSLTHEHVLLLTHWNPDPFPFPFHCCIIDAQKNSPHLHCLLYWSQPHLGPPTILRDKKGQDIIFHPNNYVYSVWCLDRRKMYFSLKLFCSLGSSLSWRSLVVDIWRLIRACCHSHPQTKSTVPEVRVLCTLTMSRGKIWWRLSYQ